MDYKVITDKYYSKWLGNDNVLNEDNWGVKFIHSSERNKIQYGYGQQFDLYIFFQPTRVIFSYGDKLSINIKELTEQMKSLISLESIKQKLEQLFCVNINHSIKYCFNKIPQRQLNSRPLTHADYYQYSGFFKNNNPHCMNIDWLDEYFHEMVKEHLCCGLFVDNRLVSCSDAPGMPYMQDAVQEIGINTLEIYKGKGYATDVCITCAKEIVESGKCPQWSTSIDNIASQRLAERVGFIKYADVLSMSL